MNFPLNSWNIDQHKAYAAEMERRARKEAEIQKARRERSERQPDER